MPSEQAIHPDRGHHDGSPGRGRLCPGRFDLDMTRQRRPGRGTELDPCRETPPVFTIVGSNTVVNKSVRNWLAAERVEIEGEISAEKPVPLPLLSNTVEGIPLTLSRAILIDFPHLKSGERIKTDVNQCTVADPLRPAWSPQPGHWCQEHRRRRVVPGNSTNAGSKRGPLGEDLRRVVSVSMLAALWDAKSGSHILGVRASRGWLLPTLLEASDSDRLIRFADQLNAREARIRAFKDGAAVHLAARADR